MITLETTQTVPLTLSEDGGIRVKGTRLLIDTIIGAHKRGECPEEIFDSFPSEEYTVADVYSIIGYYLTHKDKIEKYLTQRKREGEEIMKQIECLPDYKEKRNQLRKMLTAHQQNKDLKS